MYTFHIPYLLTFFFFSYSSIIHTHNKTKDNFQSHSPLSDVPIYFFSMFYSLSTNIRAAKIEKESKFHWQALQGWWLGFLLAETRPAIVRGPKAAWHKISKFSMKWLWNFRFILVLEVKFGFNLFTPPNPPNLRYY